MIAKRRLGPLLIWTSVLVPLILWYFGGALDELPVTRYGEEARIALAVGQGAGLTGMAMLSMSFVLSARLRWLEGLFGGLDKMYRTHHRLGLWAFGLLLVHPLALALRLVPHRMDGALSFFFPTHGRLAVNVGVVAFWLFVVLILLTLASWVPYDKWKLSHKALGLVLVVGMVHMLFVEPTPGQSVAVAELSVLRTYMTALVGIGLAAAVYKTIVLPLQSHHPYTVSDVDRLNDDVVRVELEPTGPPIEFTPGQFVFVTFQGAKLTRESHPFTLCSPADASTLTITVKALGDYTTRLYEYVEPGVTAALEGPYGRFDYRDGGRRQVWIAGGVGVTPFVSWVRQMVQEDDHSRHVEFYYCVHDRSDAVYTDTFEAASQELPDVNVALVCSVEDGHFHARQVEHVEDADIFMCGPKRLTNDLRRQFRQRGVPDARIHFEDFEFR